MNRIVRLGVRQEGKKAKRNVERLLHIFEENCFRHRSVPPAGGISSQN